MRNLTKEYLQNHKILNEKEQVLPITRKQATIFFLSIDSNLLFREFYQTYPNEALKILPMVLSIGFQSTNTALNSFITSLLEYMDISKIHYSFEHLDQVEKKLIKETSITNIFYSSGKISLLQKKIHPDYKNDVLSSFLFRELPENSSKAINSLFVLKILEPYLIKKHPEKYNEVFNDISTIFHRVPINDYPISSIAPSASSDINTNKLSYFMEITQNTNLIFEENLKYSDVLEYSASRFRSYPSSDFKRTYKYTNFKVSSQFISMFNHNEISHWINIKSKKYQCPEFYLFNSKYSNNVELFFKNNDISSTNDSPFSTSARNLIKTMVAINHPSLDKIISMNKITGKHFSTITEELFHSIESNELHSLFMGGYPSQKPYKNVTVFTDFLDNYLFNLDNLFQKHPHLLNDFKVDVAFSSYKDESLLINKNLDLFIYRTSTLKEFIKKHHTKFNSSKENVLNFLDYTPPIIDEIICSNLLVDNNLNLLLKDNFQQISHSTERIYENHILNNMFEHKDISTSVELFKELSRTNLNDLIDLYNQYKIEDKQEQNVRIETKFLRSFLLSATPKHMGENYYQVLDKLHPNLKKKYSEEDIYNLGTKGFVNSAPMFMPLNALITNFYQELREKNLHSTLDCSKKTNQIKDKRKI